MYKEKQSLKEDKILAKELHKPARKRFQTRKTVTLGINDLWQADLVDMQKYSTKNKNYKYILMVIDTFSKKGYARPIKNKGAIEVTNAFKSILKEAKDSPKNLHSDEGLEFFNSTFQDLMKLHNINHYNTFTKKKAAICERWNRTIKSMMWKVFTERNSEKWIDILQSLIDQYNNKKHGTIKMAPNQVNKSNEHQIKNILAVSKTSIKEPKFKINDIVRISIAKGIFTKGYTQSWTEELFKIIKVKNTVPWTYEIADLKGQKMKGTYYEKELQKTKLPDFKRIEKILKKRKNDHGQDEIFVKYIDYDNRFNEWIKANDNNNIEFIQDPANSLGEIEKPVEPQRKKWERKQYVKTKTYSLRQR